MKNLRTWAFCLIGLGVAVALAVFASPFASQDPDGLEKVAEDQGFQESGEVEPAWDRAPAPDYQFPRVTDRRRSTALAGLAGTLLVFGAGVGLAWVLRRRKSPASP
ncbi:MAG: PDGLE domain-containing protein [Candidatus Brocadiae bacterium]|nr:PDGLE domain-containing protein [Candidatus Brocadiia bacterium]